MSISSGSGCAKFTIVAAAVVSLADVVLVVTAAFGGGQDLQPPFVQPGGPGGGVVAAPHVRPSATVIAPGIPSISDRHFRTGKAHGEATGAVSLTLDLPTDKDKAYAQDGLVW